MIAIFSSALLQDSTGLISVDFLYKILDFGYIFHWDFTEAEQFIVEYKEMKNKLSNLILKFLEIALNEKKHEVIWEYLKIIKKKVPDNTGSYFKNLNISYHIMSGNSRKDSLKSSESYKPDLNYLYLIYKLLKILYMTNKKSNNIFSNIR